MRLFSQGDLSSMIGFANFMCAVRSRFVLKANTQIVASVWPVIRMEPVHSQFRTFSSETLVESVVLGQIRLAGGRSC